MHNPNVNEKLLIDHVRSFRDNTTLSLLEGHTSILNQMLPCVAPFDREALLNAMITELYIIKGRLPPANQGS